MKICAAQTIPVKGDIAKNIENHVKLIKLAAKEQADIIVFPELSLTGYEPDLAETLATTQDDSRFDVFQNISDTEHIIIAFGLPTKAFTGICISLIVFQPESQRQTYSKAYLHPGEEVYFIPGENLAPIAFKTDTFSFAICYETSVQQHTKNMSNHGANIYLASVLDSVKGVDKDLNRIANIAKTYNMSALMANLAGESGGYHCAGKSSVWNPNGIIKGQLNETNEGIIVYDTDSQEITKVQL